MNQHKSGFTIIELLVYFSLLCFLSFALFSWLTRVVLINNVSCPFITGHIAGDCFARDMRSAGAKKEDWLVKNRHEIVFCTRKETIGWLLKKNVLHRITGKYDTTKKLWLKKTTSIVAHTIDELNFSFNETNTKMHMVCMNITKLNKTFSHSVCLRREMFV